MSSTALTLFSFRFSPLSEIIVVMRYKQISTCLFGRMKRIWSDLREFFKLQLHKVVYQHESKNGNFKRSRSIWCIGMTICQGQSVLHFFFVGLYYVSARKSPTWQSLKNGCTKKISALEISLSKIISLELFLQTSVIKGCRKGVPSKYCQNFSYIRCGDTVSRLCILYTAGKMSKL